MNITDEVRHRNAAITAADKHVAECAGPTALPVDASPASARHWRRAAKLSSIAADFYRGAGLGLRAIAAWQGAATCYAALGMRDDAERCRLKAVSIPVYYEED